jgi:hypothetical protein
LIDTSPIESNILTQIDGGSNSHVFTERHYFSSMEDIDVPVQVLDGSPVVAKGIEVVIMKVDYWIIPLWPSYYMPNNPQNPIVQRQH